MFTETNERTYTRPRRSDDKRVQVLKAFEARRTASLYSRLIGRGQTAVRAVPAMGGTVQWLDLATLGPVEWPKWREESINQEAVDGISGTQMEEATKSSQEMITRSDWKYMTNQGEAYFVSQQDVEMNDKFGSYGDDIPALKALPFEDRRTWFKSQMDRSINAQGRLNVNVHRATVVADSLDAICPQDMLAMHAPMKVIFQGETKVFDDAGGIYKSYIELLKDKIFTPEMGLFEYDDDNGKYKIDPNALYANQKLIANASDLTTSGMLNLSTVSRESGRSRNHLQVLHFIGRIMGKVLFDGERMPVHLTPNVYKSLLQEALHLEDLEEVDGQLYAELCWVRDTEDAADLICEVFAVHEKDAQGNQILFPLKSGGENMEVTEATKMDWVELKFRHALRGRVEKELQSLCNGFWEVLNPHLISIFSWQELEMMLCGSMNLDLDDWQSNTRYVEGKRIAPLAGAPYSAEHPVIVWFWEVMHEMTPDQHIKTLQFATGSQSVPPEGFKGLAGQRGLFSIKRVKHGNRSNGGLTMPIGHTCFNSLDLPEFSTKEELQKMLIMAVEMGIVNEFIME